jgi:Asp-tRNA(Asn)/Glu-tRNA(Gln) amidotransferase A subunit family amidase
VRARLTTVGPLARTADDLALAFAVLSGTHDDGALPNRAVRFEDARHRRVDLACAAAVDVAAAALAEAGIEIDAATPPFQVEAEDAFLVLSAVETRAALARLMPSDDASPQLVAVWGSVCGVDGDPPDLRALWRRADAWLDDAQVLIAPAAAEPAYPLGRTEGVFELFAHCTLASALGLPALVVPLGNVGVQLIGRRGGEWQLLRLARLLEERVS